MNTYQFERDHLEFMLEFFQIRKTSGNKFLPEFVRNLSPYHSFTLNIDLPNAYIAFFFPATAKDPKKTIQIVSSYVKTESQKESEGKRSQEGLRETSQHECERADALSPCHDHGEDGQGVRQARDHRSPNAKVPQGPRTRSKGEQISTFLWGVIITLAVLKLAGIISLSWWWVLSPILVSVAFGVLMSVFARVMMDVAVRQAVAIDAARKEQERKDLLKKIF